MSHVSAPSSNWTSGSSRIQLSDQLLPAACDASPVGGSPFLPSGKADNVYTGTDSSSASGRSSTTLAFASEPGLQLAQHCPIDLVKDPVAVADPKIGTPPIQYRIQLPNHLTDRNANGKRSDYIAHPIPDN